MKEFETDKNSILIEEYGEEYKSLLKKYILNTSKYQEEAIDISDLSSIDKQAKRVLNATQISKKKQKLANLISLLGLIYVFVGFVGLIVSLSIACTSEKEGANLETIIAVIFTVLSFIGAVCSSAAFCLRGVSTKKYGKVWFTKFDDEPKESDFQVIMLWKEIEMLLYKIAPDETKTDLHAILKHLNNNRNLDNKDLLNIKTVYECRNKILHSNSRTNYDVQTIMKTGNDIVLKLYNKLY